MHWITKIIVLIIIWSFWVLIAPFPIKKINIDYVSLISSFLITLFGFILYLKYHDYSLMHKILQLLIALPFVYFITSAISLGYVLEHFGDPDYIKWNNTKRLISNSILASIIIISTAFSMELTGYIYGNKQNK